MPLVKMKGFFIAMKGPGAQQELEEAQNALDTLGSGEPEVLSLTLPGGRSGTWSSARSCGLHPKAIPATGAPF